MTQQTLEQLALELPPLERERLAARLLSSLDQEPLSETDQAWIDEAERRLAELTEGRVQGVAGEGLIDRIRRDMGWRS